MAYYYTANGSSAESSTRMGNTTYYYNSNGSSAETVARTNWQCDIEHCAKWSADEFHLEIWYNARNSIRKGRRMRRILWVIVAVGSCAAFAKGGFWKAVNAIQTTVDVATTVSDVAGRRTSSQPAAQPAAPASAETAQPAAPSTAAAPATPSAAVPAADVAAFAGARTTATETAVPGVSYGQIVFKKPATPEQIAEAKKAYLADNRELEDARLRMEKVDDATVSAALAAFNAASYVEIKESKLSTLAPFAMLGNVTKVALNKIPCADMKPFAACAKLKALELRYCDISDISGLSALQALETLDLYGAKVSCSFAPLAACTNLRKVDFYAVKGPQEVYDSLGSLKQVKEFLGGLTKMTSIKWLLNVPQAETVQIFAEKIDDLSPISTLANLTYFRGWNMDGGRLATALGDLSFLANCRKLRKLELPGSAYSNIALIGSFTELEELDLSNAKQPVDVSFVKSLPKLTRITLRGTEVVNGGAIPANVKIYKDKKTKGL